MYNFDDSDQDQWNRAIEQFPEANMLQSWEWGEMNSTLGRTVIRRIITAEDGIVGLIGCTVKDAKRGRYLEVAGGPLIDWEDAGLVDATVGELRAIGKQHNCVFIRIRPQLLDKSTHHATMARIGATTSLMHVTADHTSIIDLSLDAEQLLANMRQQTRYEVRRAEKRSIKIDQVDPLNHLELFHEIQVRTASRQNFYPPSLAFLYALCDSFGDNVNMYKASKDDTILNLAIVISQGNEAAYFEAASTDDARREPGAYAIVWQAMLDAKNANRKSFNLWGTAPPGAQNHRYSGVTTFKRGFGGCDVAYLPAHDIVLRPTMYRLTRLVELLRKKRRKL